MMKRQRRQPNRDRMSSSGSSSGLPFYLIKFADSKVAAGQVSNVLGDELMGKLDNILKPPPKRTVTRIPPFAESLTELQEILSGKVGELEVEVPEDVKAELESARIDFIELGTLRRDR
jgi:hypothetical protein